jgi:uncharacterized protein (UPF0332 family)
MKEEDRQELIHYRLERARETLQEALLMQRERHWNACINRLYYACFYAVTALLALQGLETGKHSGVKSLFNHHWIKPNKISKQYGRLYNTLFESRQEGDYIDFVFFDEEAVEPLIPQVSDFIDSINCLIEQAIHQGERSKE